MNKRELKFSISTDDLDSDELFSIQFIGDKINVTTSSKALASSTIDVTTTEGGFNFKLKSRSQSHINFNTKQDSLKADKDFSLNDMVSPCQSSLENSHPPTNFKDNFDSKENYNNYGTEEFEETSLRENTSDINTQIDLAMEQNDDNPVEYIGEEDDFTHSDDRCSIDTVIENKHWKDKGEKSDSLLNWDYIDEHSVYNEENACSIISDFDAIPNFLSLPSSFASSDGNHGMENLDKLSFCSQNSSDQKAQEVNPEEIDYFEEKQISARPTMFMPHKELYSAPKVRSTFVD